MVHCSNSHEFLLFRLLSLRPILPQNTTFITPGIRPKGSSKGDQKRVMTPREAAEKGANYLVIGRPILASDDPRETLRLIQEELA